jgi:superfamily II DNA/RNA helicase
MKNEKDLNEALHGANEDAVLEEATFKTFNLQPEIYKAIAKAGYLKPTPIQEKAIPKILRGFNLRISAQTGTGKTAAFILPALNRLAVPSKERFKGPRVLILVPTRELAIQVAEEAAKFSEFLPRVKTVCIYGGAPYPPQNRQLSRPYDILVATPGRLMDHMERERINLSQVEMFILDEADRMLDMGFIKPVEEISAAATREHQTLLFSATMTKDILRLSKELMKESMEISVTPHQTKHENIEQHLFYVDDLNHKFQILDHLLTDPVIKQAIVFTSTKRFADELVADLRDRGFSAAALHGDMNQSQRTRTIIRLRNEEIRILVATDVAARGIDVQTISHVINFDLPNNREDYVHRIGRTGRAGASGIALSFASSKDRDVVMEIEHFTGQQFVPQVIPGLEPSMKSKPKQTPFRKKRGGGAPQRFKAKRQEFRR